MVYITSGLFGNSPPYSQHDFSASAHPHTYNDMVDSQPTTGLGKRKRKAHGDDAGPSPKHISLSCSELDRSGSGSHMALARPSPTREGLSRLHGHNPTSQEASEQRSYSKLPTLANFERRPLKHMRRSNPKLVKVPSHLMDMEFDLPSSPPVQRADIHTTSDLRPCHACGTAPRRKRDLENYLDCQKCQQKTCYICARQCYGCQRDVCKDCVVEVGEEGEPWCLTCYQRINL